MKIPEDENLGGWNLEGENFGGWEHLEDFSARRAFGGLVQISLSKLLKLPQLKILEVGDFGGWKIWRLETWWLKILEDQNIRRIFRWN